MTDYGIFAGPYYLVADDGTHCYPIDRRMVCGWTHGSDHWNQVFPTPGGFRTVEAKIGGGYSDPTTVWLIGPRPLGEVTVNSVPEQVTDGWALKDPAAASEKFPATLTTDEWKARNLGDSDTEDGFMAQRIYQRHTRAVEKPPRVYPTSVLSPLAGSPDPAPGRAWHADQPMSLIYSRNYHHLFPGYLTGLRDAVISALETEFGQRRGGSSDGGVYDRGTTGQYRGIEVAIHVPYETPRWRTEQKVSRSSGRRLKATDRVPVLQRVAMNIEPGDKVLGATKADAVARLNSLVSEWVEWVRSYRVVACDHCSGTGTVEVQNQRPPQP